MPALRSAGRDGNYGVLAGSRCCVWTNEEGSRFVPVMMGSDVYAGAFTLQHALAAAPSATCSCTTTRAT